jgi:hypothetical protein
MVQELINPLENVAGFTQNLLDIDSRWKYLCEEIDKVNLEQLDLLHDIENGRFDVFRGYQKLAEVQSLRKYRRKLKNERELLEPLYKFYTQYKKLHNDLFRVKVDMAKIQDRHDNWVYNKRIIKPKEIEQEAITSE